jgi:hypothetical protein
MNNDIENALLEYYPEYKMFQSEYEFKDSIHSTNIELLGRNVKVRIFSPVHAGDKPYLFYYIQK